MNIQTQDKNQSPPNFLTILAEESKQRLLEIAQEFEFQEKLNEILNKEDHYKFCSYRDPLIFESIFLKDIALFNKPFFSDFVKSLEGLRFSPDKVSLHHREFIFHLCRLGQIHKELIEDEFDVDDFTFDVRIRDWNQVLESNILQLIKNPEIGSYYWTLIYENQPQKFKKIPIVPRKSEELANRLLYLNNNIDRELFIWDGRERSNFSEFYWSILRGGIFNTEKIFRFMISKRQTFQASRELVFPILLSVPDKSFRLKWTIR
ncbi:MAG: hypothetical protein LPK45_09585 [Bacteroidota bacterium]|nr:hypothetical protein [Bacteroidota bacterium]MDX5431345.1 hypothetical protein [Bacteroidota bacterium]MDX5470073.1 hypothetical protein [Bacteroidota bacterium]